DQSPEIQKHPDWVFLSRPILRLMYLGFNMRDHLLRNETIRQSIIASVHKVEVLGQDPDYSVVHNLIPFTLFGTELAPQPDPYNLEKAKQLLQSYLRKKKRRLSLQLWHARVSENREQMLTRIADAIRAAGFEVTLKIVPS